MKRLSEYLAVAAVLTFCVALACGPKPGQPPDPTPVPQPTMIPIPTEIPPQPTTPPEPVPTSAGPCRQESFANQWRGDCTPSPTCVGPDSAGFYKGTLCTQKGTP